ncbi:MAG: 6-carboxytetrahydropterin synthase, partial [Kiritimatiellae bacterium]|nr:6-carboxytetrahydropterin synthase [Kiritimatiellia bacterium]
NSESQAESEIAAVVMKHGMRAVAMPYRSTAENLARHFFGVLREHVAGLSRVRVWETPDSSAEYSE